MKKYMIVFLALMFIFISCSSNKKKIVHLRYSSLDKIKAIPVVVNQNAGVDQVSVFIANLTEKYLKKQKRFEYMDLNNWSLMRDFPNTVLKINKVHNQMKRVLTFFQNNKMEKAFELSERLLMHLSKNFQYYEDLDEVYYIKSFQAASALLSDVIDAERFFKKLAVMDARYDFDSNRFGPGILKQFKEAQKASYRLREGVITVNSSPSTARVFIDGQYMGVTPFQSEKLKIGEHFVKVEAEGFLPYGEVVNVLAQENPVSANFKAFSIHRELNKLRRAVLKSHYKKEVLFPKAVLKFVRVIPFDQMIYIKTRTVKEDIYVAIYIYDLPTTSLYRTGSMKLNLDSDRLEEKYFNQLDKLLDY